MLPFFIILCLISSRSFETVQPEEKYFPRIDFLQSNSFVLDFLLIKKSFLFLFIFLLVESLLLLSLLLLLLLLLLLSLLERMLLILLFIAFLGKMSKKDASDNINILLWFTREEEARNPKESPIGPKN